MFFVLGGDCVTGRVTVELGNEESSCKAATSCPLQSDRRKI